MTESIRDMTSEELPLICGRLAEIDPWVTLEITAEKLLAACNRDPQRRKYVLLDGAEIRGTVMFRPTNGYPYLVSRGGAKALLEHHCVASADELPQSAYVNILGVFAGSQGRSYGSRLLAFAEDKCAGEVEHICLCVSDFNTAAQRFYIRHGYIEIGRIPDFVKSGYSELIMAKDLPGSAS